MQMPEPASIVAFHCVRDSRILAQVDGGACGKVAAGTIVLLPHNDAHILASEAGSCAVDAEMLVRMQREGVLARVDHGGGDALTRIVCGLVGSGTTAPAPSKRCRNCSCST